MLLYALGNKAPVTGFIDFLGIAEPDQLVGGILVEVLHGVIQKPRRKSQWADWVMLIMIWEAYSTKYHQVTYRVLVSLDRLEGGVRRRLLLYLFICLAHNEIVYLVHVWFLEILLPRILVDGLIYIIFIEVGHISIYFWALGAQISDGRYLWVGEGGLSFSQYGWLVAVTVCWYRASLQFLHCSGEFVGCS